MASKKKRERERQVVGMLSIGMSQREVARQLGLHYNTINTMCRTERVKRLLASTDPVVQADIAARAEETIEQQTVAAVTHMGKVIAEKTEEVVLSLQEKFDRAAEPAFAQLMELMQSAESEGVRLKCLESILDRSGVSPKRQIHQKHEVTHQVIELRGSPAWMHEIRAGMVEIGVDPESLPQINEEGVTLLIDKSTGEIVG